MNTRVLKMICCLTGSQWRDFKMFSSRMNSTYCDELSIFLIVKVYYIYFDYFTHYCFLKIVLLL